MNYYPFHIGDFRSGTANMSRQTRWIYRDLLDVYYDTEKPLTTDFEALCYSIGVEAEDERRIVESLLRFKFVKGDQGYRNEVCDRVIAEYQIKAETAKANGKRGGRPRKQSGPEEKPSGFPSGSDPQPAGTPLETGLKTNQEPITNNQLTPSNEGVARTLQGEACMAMKAAGMAGVNPSNPKLTALLEAGITVPELVAAAADAVSKGKPFAYALASAEGRRRDAATAPLPNVQPDAPVETYAQRAARQRVEEVAPMAARKAPGSAFDAAQRFMRGDVVDVTPAPQQLQVM
jgi:uncharacterized protein YdaU (DUF1376 family)